MSRIKTLLSAACLLAGLVPATAHHASRSQSAAHLAFWGAYDAPSAVDLATGACQDRQFWEKGFVSIYSQGGKQL